MNFKSNFESGADDRELSRRRFLKTGAVAAIGASAPAGLLNAAVLRRTRQPGANDPAAFLTQANFAPHLNTSFRVRLPDGRAAALTLLDVENLVPATEGECFSLKFAVAPHAGFPQGTHLIEQAALGQFHLFLAPVDRPGRILIYEAIINRAWA